MDTSWVPGLMQVFQAIPKRGVLCYGLKDGEPSSTILPKAKILKISCCICRTLDDPFKYFMGICGIFLLSLCNEMLSGFRRHRDNLMFRKWKGRPSIRDDAVKTILFGIQMMIAYLLMLVAMLYESVLFFTLICGLMVGHFLALRTFSPPSGSGIAATEPLWEDPGNYGSDQAYITHAANGRTPCFGGN